MKHLVISVILGVALLAVMGCSSNKTIQTKTVARKSGHKVGVITS